jgi:hypothetical protein
MAIRRRTIITGLACLLAAGLLAGCSIVAPIPFGSSTASPGAESAKTPGVAASTPGSLIGERVGISAGSAIIAETDPAVRDQMLQAIANTGARWFGIDVDWSAIQGGGPNSYGWAATDAVVKAARAKGLKIMGMIGYAPPWARPADCPANTNKCLPASPEPYAAFARAAASHYGSASTIPELRGSIEVWQVWNEPNHYPFVQTVDVGSYTRMLKRAYAEIKAVDPATTVIAGGTSPAPNDPSGRDMSPVQFLQRIYASGGKGFFDAFSHHPYSFPCNPLQHADWNAFTQTKFLHDVMVEHGDGAKKIWGTEAGAPTGADVGTCTPGNTGMSVTEATQAQYVSDYFKGWFGEYGSFTGPLIWFQIRDNGTNPNYWDDHFGLLHRDFTPKPAYRTFTLLVRG